MDQSGKRHVLIVDDMIRLDINNMFASTGMDVDVRFVRTVVEAEKILKLWHEQGITADIVSYDSDGISEERGTEALQTTMQWLKSIDRVPHKTFLHSLVPNSHLQNSIYYAHLGPTYGTEVINSREYEILAAEGRYVSENLCPENNTGNLISFLNNNWHTQFSCTQEEAAQSAATNIPLTVVEAEQLVINGRMDILDVLGRVSIQDFKKTSIGSIPQHVIDDYMKGIEDGKVTDTGIPYLQFSFKKSDIGAMHGALAFTIEDIERLNAQNKKPILVLKEAENINLPSLKKVAGIVLLSEECGHLRQITSNHGIPLLSGTVDDFEYEGCAPELNEDNGSLCLTVMYEDLSAGTPVTISNETIYVSHLIIDNGVFDTPDMNAHKVLMLAAKGITEDHQGMSIFANADNAQQIIKLINMRIEGVGLLRTEHMFLGPENLPSLLRAVLSEPSEGVNQSGIASCKEIMKQEFLSVFRATRARNADFKLNIRLLDALTGELFTEEHYAKISRDLGIPESQIRRIDQKLVDDKIHGAKFGLYMPDFYVAQCEAIFEAIMEMKSGSIPRIMIPFVETPEQLEQIRALIEQAKENTGYQGSYEFGAMIETLSAVDFAEEIAKQCDFICFGTNDLTSEQIGVSRQDIVDIEAWMIRTNHIGKSPFETLLASVADKVTLAVSKARSVKPDIEIGACGVHASETEAIAIFERLKFDYISVVPKPENLAAAPIQIARACIAHYRERTYKPQAGIGNRPEVA